MSVYENLEPIDLSEIRTYELLRGRARSRWRILHGAVGEGETLKGFLDKLPNILAVQSMRELATRMRRARDAGKPIIWGIGGHVVKTGLAPVIIDLMDRGFVTAVAVNGSVLVHDTEIALVGSTSEDVDATLGSGDFGAAKETGEILNKAARDGRDSGIGLGEAMGRELRQAEARERRQVAVVCGVFPEAAGHGTSRDRCGHRTFSRFVRRSGVGRDFAQGLSADVLARSRDERRRRVYQLRFGRHPARDIFKGRDSRAKSRQRTARYNDREF